MSGIELEKKYDSLREIDRKIHELKELKREKKYKIKKYEKILTELDINIVDKYFHFRNIQGDKIDIKMHKIEFLKEISNQIGLKAEMEHEWRHVLKLRHKLLKFNCCDPALNEVSKVDELKKKIIRLYEEKKNVNENEMINCEIEIKILKLRINLIERKLECDKKIEEIIKQEDKIEYLKTKNPSETIAIADKEIIKLKKELCEEYDKRNKLDDKISELKKEREEEKHQIKYWKNVKVRKTEKLKKRYERQKEIETREKMSKIDRIIVREKTIAKKLELIINSLETPIKTPQCRQFFVPSTYPQRPLPPV